MQEAGKGISWDDMRRLTVKDGELYWQGQKVRTEQRVSLRWYELVLATLVAVATLLQAGAAVAPLLGWGPPAGISLVNQGASSPQPQPNHRTRAHAGSEGGG